MCLVPIVLSYSHLSQHVTQWHHHSNHCSAPRSCHNRLLRSHALMPWRHRTKLSGTVWIGPDCPGPSERLSFCPTNLPRGICAMCHGLAYVILLYPRFGHNLTFICSNPSNPYVLFLEPRFCFITYVQPLCFSIVHLLCTIFIFCFPFQVTHSNHSSISMHVIFLLVLQYGNQLGQASTSILSDLLNSLRLSTSLRPLK